MDSLSDVSLIIKTFERRQALERLLESIDAQGYEDCPVLVADDSKDPYRETILDKYGHVVDEYLVLPFNSGVSKGRNELLGRVETEYFVLNDDDFVYGDITNLETAKHQLIENDLDILGGEMSEKRRSYYNKWIPKKLSDIAGLYTEYWKRGAWVADIVETSDNGIRFESYSDISSSPLRCDLALNFFVARTEAVRGIVGGWNPKLKSSGEHWEFFYRCKESDLKVASSQDFGVYHIQDNNELYNSFRYSKKQEMISISLRDHDLEYLKKDSGTYYRNK